MRILKTGKMFLELLFIHKEVIQDTLFGAAGFLWCILGIGRTIIKKRIFDYYEFFSKHGSNEKFNKKPYNSVIGSFAIIYFFKRLPNKRLNPEFYSDTKSKSLLSELRGFSKVFGYLLFGSLFLLTITLILKFYVFR